ncbi:hypothetical protein [Hominisplanchenecus murintestinalis]
MQMAGMNFQTHSNIKL